MQFPLGDGRGLGIGSQSLQQFYYFAQSQGWWSPLFSNLSVDPTSGRGLGIGPNLIKDQIFNPWICMNLYTFESIIFKYY